MTCNHHFMIKAIMRGDVEELRRKYDFWIRQRYAEVSGRDEPMSEIEHLRRKRDDLWRRFQKLQKRDSFSGLEVSGDLNEVQQELDELEDEDYPSERYYTEINIEI